MAIDKNINILVVDDSIGIRIAAKKIFNKLGYSKVALADDGTTALEQLKKDSFDLVVADWNMTKMSGMELLQAMRADASLSDIPFLLVTGDEDQDRIIEAIKAGINNFMTKPYRAKVLSEKIERIFTFREEVKQRES